MGQEAVALISLAVIVGVVYGITPIHPTTQDLSSKRARELSYV